MTAAIQVSAKKASGEIYVVGGDDYAQFFANLAAVLDNEQSALAVVKDMAATLGFGPSTAQATQTLQNAFPQAAVISQDHTPWPEGAVPAQQYQQQQAAQAQPAQRMPAGPPPGVQGRYCKHGEMAYRTGTNANSGKAWKGYFCPTDKGAPDKCDPQFVR